MKIISKNLERILIGISLFGFSIGTGMCIYNIKSAREFDNMAYVNTEQINWQTSDFYNYSNQCTKRAIIYSASAILSLFPATVSRYLKEIRKMREREMRKIRERN